MATGIRQRHRKACNERGRCDCSWQAEVFDHEAGEKLRRTFPTHAAARGWRHDALVALKRGELRAATTATLREAAETWLDGARRGAVRTRSGDRYKPSAIRGYEQALRLRVLPELGSRRLSELRRGHVQDLVDDLIAAGLAPATIQATMIPLKAICRREVSRGRLAVNPTTGLEQPAVRGGRDRIADPGEGAHLLEALPDEDRALWATAMYGGLRRGELMALRVSDITATENVIHVHYGWDAKEGRIETKGRNRRRVPIPAVLRRHLLEHLARSGRRDADLMFGRTSVSPFSARRLTERADEAWGDADLARITLHECRHTFASLMIAAGCNAKALSTYMGHASIAITMDRYGHLLPGHEGEAAGLLDTYLTRAVTGTSTGT